MTRRSMGGNCRNGMNRSHAAVQVATVCGYFVPQAEASNSANAVRAVSSFGAV